MLGDLELLRNRSASRVSAWVRPQALPVKRLSDPGDSERPNADSKRRDHANLCSDTSMVTSGLCQGPLRCLRGWFFITFKAFWEWPELRSERPTEKMLGPES